MKNKQLLIINQSQFGYHSDTFYLCKYLKKKYDISYICWDYGMPFIEMNGISVIPVSRKGRKIERYFRFIIEVLKEINRQKYDIHFIKYFPGCLLLKVFNRSKIFIFDIRTCYVGSYIRSKRLFFDWLMKFESSFFKHITIISKSLKDKLGIKNAYILPLGADIISEKYKDFNALKLLYVGTLSQRRIMDTLKGFHKFYNEYSNIADISYTIIGSGYGNEENDLLNYVRNNNIENSVKILGYIKHSDLKQYFDQHNIGVSYIPITEYFDFQPPTKTFEYLLSGMPVIASETYENRLVINKSNGILIRDNCDDFYKGLIFLFNNMNKFSSKFIVKNAMKYRWVSIANKFHIFLNSLISSN